MLPCYSWARKAGLCAGRGCQIFMPTLLVGGGLIQQSWGHSGFLFFLRPCVLSLSILCSDPGLLGLKGCLCFVPRTFLCREFGMAVGISTDATIITEHRLSTHRQAGNLISTHTPQVPCWLCHWAGSLGVQGAQGRAVGWDSKEKRQPVMWHAKPQ